MDILEELEWIAEQVGGGSIIFKKADALVNHVNVLRIAAESERDELKAKLAEIESKKRNPVDEVLQQVVAHVPSGDSEDHLSIELPVLKSILESVYIEPAQRITEPYRWTFRFNNGNTANIYETFEQARNDYELSEGEPMPLYAAPAQRITEQDAREIVVGYISSGGLFNLTATQCHKIERWLSGECRTLLAKLNEHREPVHQELPKFKLLCDSIMQNGVHTRIEYNDDGSVKSHEIDGVEQVTSNKAEVPEGWKLVPIEPDANMQAASASAIRFETTLINKMWTANAVYRAAIEAAPLPPLKGGASNNAEVSSDKVLINKSLVYFLNGECQFNGYWFGERSKSNGLFWWRAYLPSLPPLKGGE